jgi:RNA polymerase sigma-70 factor (ECF subfamily)
LDFNQPAYADPTLVTGCKRNDRVAQERLYQKYFDQAYRLCNRYTSQPSDALAVVNEGFLKVFRHIASFRFDAGTLGAWISRIMVNTAIDTIRKKNRMIPHQELEQAEPTSFTEDILSRLHADEIMAIIKMLPAVSQAVFNLYEIEGYQHKEIAAMMQISESTSRWHLTEAKKKLRELYFKHHHYPENVNEEKIYP